MKTLIIVALLLFTNCGGSNSSAVNGNSTGVEDTSGDNTDAGSNDTDTTTDTVSGGGQSTLGELSFSSSTFE